MSSLRQGRGVNAFAATTGTSSGRSRCWPRARSPRTLTHDGLEHAEKESYPTVTLEDVSAAVAYGAELARERVINLRAAGG